MFPFIRFFKDILMARRLPPLENFNDTHVSHHICWPWDLDMFAEMNNGRVLTISDLGRFALAQRGGLIALLFKKKWALAMAGATVRYRKRITIFQKFTTHSRAVCWDDRFIYLEHAMFFPDGTCANHILYRAAVLENRKAIDPARVAEGLGRDPVSPPFPDWIKAWVDADAQRPWPPMQDPAQDS
ncbi:hypothetical protein ASD8599_00399 [Ascidiaceihabitans donghaensis]|uniref:Thioesterase domain-containing protein n=1 Tax=Ascidiaceihabitans donghaensis TaxID=1510460 RepID=A0A2R8B9W1_9RHOB|nr:thioesterase family protein [Ascidiaceihabitans donghaensis]SPH19664.1 hypothetical protein ASD8599_00399 [Ascidiaceihabitans donghaensis]